jgi:hypothetical protein
LPNANRFGDLRRSTLSWCRRTTGFQRSPRPEQSDQGAPDQSAKIAHRSEYRLIRGRGQPFPAEGPKNAMLQLERLDRALDGKLMICRGC